MITPTLHYDLFHDKLLRRRLSSFGFPNHLSDRFRFIEKWLQFTAAGHMHNQLTEAEFLHDLFVEILGYRSPFHNDHQLAELEFHPAPALGFFGENCCDIVAEITISDRYQGKPEPRHPETEWLLVTDFQRLWLYHQNYPSLLAQSFIFEELADDEKMREFYFLLSRRTLLKGLPTSKEVSRTTQLLQECQQLENDVLRGFYQQYTKIRGQLIKDFRYRLRQSLHNSPSATGATTESAISDSKLDEDTSDQEQLMEHEALRNAQKLLNRVIFIAFGETNGILPRHLMRDAYEFKNPYIDQPVWENYKAVFRWIRQGNSRHVPPINDYDYSLFSEDPVLDQELFVGDELCRQIKELNRFDLKEEVSAAVLACFWDELIKDIGQFKKDRHTLSKKRTPKFPAKILLQTASAVTQVRQYLYSRNTHPLPSADAPLEEKIAFWQNHYENLQGLKIIHSRCGAGIILIAMLDFLLAEYQYTYRQLLSLGILPHNIFNLINHNLADSAGEPSSDHDVINTAEIPLTESWLIYILKNHLYGCDIFPEMLEIARLNLALRLIPYAIPVALLESRLLVGTIEDAPFDQLCYDAIRNGNALVISKL